MTVSLECVPATCWDIIFRHHLGLDSLRNLASVSKKLYDTAHAVGAFSRRNCELREHAIGVVSLQHLGTVAPAWPRVWFVIFVPSTGVLPPSIAPNCIGIFVKLHIARGSILRRQVDSVRNLLETTQIQKLRMDTVCKLGVEIADIAAAVRSAPAVRHVRFSGACVNTSNVALVADALQDAPALESLAHGEQWPLEDHVGYFIKGSSWNRYSKE
eukprot:m.601183 g.601183  ORF g.601183 m.601183 type:complete len:214 (-) comp22440_c0_seq4:2407-3048(-)